MNYSVLILRRAQKELAKLPVGTYERAKEAIRHLGEDSKPPGCRKLAGRKGWRIGSATTESSTRLIQNNAA